jgi:hypothetical protein
MAVQVLSMFPVSNPVPQAALCLLSSLRQWAPSAQAPSTSHPLWRVCSGQLRHPKHHPRVEALPVACLGQGRGQAQWQGWCLAEAQRPWVPSPRLPSPPRTQGGRGPMSVAGTCAGNPGCGIIAGSLAGSVVPHRVWSPAHECVCVLCWVVCGVPGRCWAWMVALPVRTSWATPPPSTCRYPVQTGPSPYHLSRCLALPHHILERALNILLMPLHPHVRKYIPLWPARGGSVGEGLN